ncbi:hypothetical protein CFP56_030590 [Quercus suber]|uniref:Uncharacterized protein n=1 Tax=Quercus suber TaxID=58331 RepID=A0AAW0LUI5_QUESU
MCQSRIPTFFAQIAPKFHRRPPPPELARERHKNKRIKQFALIELVLELALVLSLSTFFFMLFLNLIEL